MSLFLALHTQIQFYMIITGLFWVITDLIQNITSLTPEPHPKTKPSFSIHAKLPEAFSYFTRN